jgi:hypothetical protein
MTRAPRTEPLPCGCRVLYSAGDRLVGFSTQCDEVTTIFARYAGKPETREVSAARSAGFDAHLAAQRGQR